VSVFSKCLVVFCSFGIYKHLPLLDGTVSMPREGVVLCFTTHSEFFCFISFNIF